MRALILLPSGLGLIQAQPAPAPPPGTDSRLNVSPEGDAVAIVVAEPKRP